MTRIVCLSDTHGSHDHVEVPAGDILIVAGDFCNRGTLVEVRSFNFWLGSLPHKHKIVVAGNHDWPFERSRLEARKSLSNARYLEDDEIAVAGLSIYGSPWQPEFCGWAFNLPRDGWELRRKWEHIPEDLDILVTHGPPKDILDMGGYHGPNHVGCADLAEVVHLRKPRLHVFGHIHTGHGQTTIGDTIFCNVSVVDEHYDVRWPATVVDL